MARRVKITIERRTHGTTRLRWQDPETGRRCSRDLGKVSRHKAAIEKRRLEQALNNGHAVASGPPTVTRLQQLVRDVWAEDISDDHRDNVLHALDLVREHVGDRLDLMTPLAVDRFKRDIRTGRQPSTVNNILRCIRAAMRQARRWGLTHQDPFADVPNVREPRSDPATWAPEDITALVNQLPRLLDRCIVWLALDGGLRAKEIANVNILTDWDTASLAVHVRNRDGVITKNTYEREVSILPEHRADMDELRVWCAQRTMEYPFYSRNNRAVSQRFSQLKRRLGFKNTLHDLRHTCATRLATVASPRDVQEYIGDRDIRTVDRHYFGRSRAERLRRLRQQAEGFNIMNGEHHDAPENRAAGSDTE